MGGRRPVMTSQEYDWQPGGWQFVTKKSRILKTQEHYAWKRELNCFQGQHLPEATFGQNLLQLYHPASGTRIQFTALEALRSWASLGQPPVQVPAAATWKDVTCPRYDFDYTFTTAYKGSTDICVDYEQASAVRPDSSSFVVRPAVDLAKGEAGRTPFLRPTGSTGLPHTEVAASLSAVPPKWQATDLKVDIEGLIKSAPVPLFWDSLELYEEDLHECGLMFLRLRAYVADNFWIAYQRYFCRVDGVLGRLIDVRLQFTKGTDYVLREHSWKEGSWLQFTGSTNKIVNLETANDHVAGIRLPHSRPVVTQLLPLTALARNTGSAGLPRELVWSTERKCELMCTRSVSSDTDTVAAVAVTRAGMCVEAFDLLTGVIWESKLPGETEVLAIAISTDTTDGGRLALGDDRGFGHIWRLETSEPLVSFEVAPAAVGRNISSAKHWVEKLQWNSNGQYVGAAAGRSTVIVSATDGTVLASAQATSGTVTAIDFAPNRPCTMAVGAYGGVTWLVGDDSPIPTSLERGAAAVQALCVSPDGTHVAVGFLDKALRIFSTAGGETDLDWAGFSSGVTWCAWSQAGSWLAAVGGTSILVVPTQFELGFTQPIVCRTAGSSEADGCVGTCGRFSSAMWCASAVHEHLLAGLEAQGGRAHLFDVRRCTDRAPRLANPVMVIAPGGPVASLAFTMHANQASEEPVDDADPPHCGMSLVVASTTSQLVVFRVPPEVLNWQCETV